MKEFYKFVETVAKLRSPDGCPWDKAQTLYSMKKDMLEEAAELADALDNKDIENIKEELGDVLLHVVIHSQIASENGLFSIKDVIMEENEKIIRRHPHVFGNENLISTDEVLKKWDEIKKKEKENKAIQQSFLDSIPKNMTSLAKAQKIQEKAAKVGFDWTNIDDIFKKLDEEILELKNAIKNNNKENISEEIGDIIFVMANIAKHTKTDADEALRKANIKFIKRFSYIENSLNEKGKSLEKATLEEMEQLWQQSKSIGL